MCGIVGFVSGIKHREKIIREMNNLIIHRGPDDEGYYLNELIALGMRRLSIIDLVSGKQPIRYKSYNIIFNGEIYNYRELRKILEEKGYSFSTNSDTEVLLKMYAEFGEKLLPYLDGMFAFAIWDEKFKRLFLARDRMGKKPLYYFFNGLDLVFASEIKAILAYPNIAKKLNLKVINSYFQYRYIIGNETFFENIYSLSPGHFINFDSKQKKLVIKKYWELPLISKKKDLGMKYYLEQTKKKVIDAVVERMISDVPIGAYLSGGLDSSIVASVMAKSLGNKKLSTFTIGFKEEEYNEFAYARLVSKKWNTDHHEILLENDRYVEAMDKLISLKDAPLSVPNEVPLYLMSKELKKYITVVLSGEGADELFGGYGKIFISYLGCKGNEQKGFMDLFLDRYNYTSNDVLKKILSTNLNKVICKEKYTYKIFQNYFKKINSLEIEDKIPYIFQNLHLQGLLQRLDTATMAASVEGRCPFVDHDLVEFVNSIPFKYKIRWKDNDLKNKAISDNLQAEEISEELDITKFILKGAFKDFVSKEIINRRKMGFPVPLDIWFKGRFSSYVKEVLEDKRTVNRGIYNAEYLISGEYFEQSGIALWMMVNLELFLRKYFD